MPKHSSPFFNALTLLFLKNKKRIWSVTKPVPDTISFWEKVEENLKKTS